MWSGLACWIHKVILFCLLSNTLFFSTIVVSFDNLSSPFAYRTEYYLDWIKSETGIPWTSFLRLSIFPKNIRRKNVSYFILNTKELFETGVSVNITFLTNSVSYAVKGMTLIQPGRMFLSHRLCSIGLTIIYALTVSFLFETLVKENRDGRVIWIRWFKEAQREEEESLCP